jgi:hypothetical protein
MSYGNVTPLGGVNADFEIFPLPGATASVHATYQSYAAKNNSWVSSGPDANLTVLVIQFQDVSSLQGSDQPLLLPGIPPGVFSIQNNAGAPGLQFSAGSSGTSVGAMTAWIPAWQALACDQGTGAGGGAPRNNAARGSALVTYYTRFNIAFVGSGTGANPTTFQLYESNTPIAGASFVLDVGAAGVQTASFSAAILADFASYFTLGFVTTNPVLTPFTEISAVLG